MPELPEVDTIRRGLAQTICDQRIKRIIVRERRLRWPVCKQLGTQLTNSRINNIQRRAKYLLIETTQGHLIIHLGMSGCLKVVPHNTPIEKHDHIDFILSNKHTLRYNDPRRFGCVLWTDQPPDQHRLLATLGPEPLEPAFNCEYLYDLCQQRRCSIKQLIMNSKVVVGVGNIYVNEALFLAGIHPSQPANQLQDTDCQQLIDSIQIVLQQAIDAGGTTLKDFKNATGKPGYFQQQLNVYGKGDEPCPTCDNPIQRQMMHQRATYFCPHCQPQPGDT